jgi:hypothetical protein
MRKVFVSEAICAQARDKLVALLDAADERGILVQHRAADNLLRHCLTQERYGLKPQTPTDFERALDRPVSSARDLANLTHEELLELQAKMVKAAGYPGRRRSPDVA